MKRQISKLTTVAAAAVLGLALFGGPSSAATVVSSFNTNTGDLVAIAWDPLTGNLFTYSSFAGTIQEFTPTGSEVDQGITRPGTFSDDFDLDFALSDLTMAGQSVGTNTLLAVNGDDEEPTIYALDKNTGGVVASISIGTTAVGIAHHPTRGSIYVSDYEDDFLIELDPNTGTEVSRISVRLKEAPRFDIDHGDVDVHPTTGNLWVISSAQQMLREMSPSGKYVGDADLGTLDLPKMAGLAFDGNGDAWVAGRNGTVHKLGDLVSTKMLPECGRSDSICTGEGDDEVDGTSSDDFIFTGDGNDTISSGAGNDTIRAGAGNDEVAAGPGADDVDGGTGDDLILGDSVAPIHLRASGGASNDVLDGGEGDDDVFGQAGADQLLGDKGADELDGGAGKDLVKGGGGADLVRGAAGADKIAGAAGNDTLLGGDGFDLLNGGSGRDTCVVDSKKERRRAKNCERFRRNF